MARILRSYEAHMSPEARLFLRTVSQFDPRRGSLKGHFVAAALGCLLGAMLIGVKLS